MMMKKLFFLLLTLPLAILAQKKEIDSLLLEKMIVANVAAGTYSGSKINSDCSLTNQRVYKSPHVEAPQIAYVTDYVLCNNGSVNMFFEVYDGANFVYVPDNSIIFNKGVDSDNIKVLLSRRSPEEKPFLKNNIGQLVAFGRDQFVEEKEKEMSAERREALQHFLIPKNMAWDLSNTMRRKVILLPEHILKFSIPQKKQSNTFGLPSPEKMLLMTWCGFQMAVTIRH